MRILFVTPYVPSPIRVRPYQLIRQLSKRHSVTVLAATPRDEVRAVPDLEQYAERVVPVMIRTSRVVRSCAAGMVRGDPLQAAYCRSPELSERFAALISEGSVDLVHIEHLRASHLLFETPPTAPAFYDAVDSIGLLLERTLRMSHSWKQRVIAAIELSRIKAYERQVLMRADGVVVTSDDDAEALRRLLPTAPISTLPNGVDLDYFEPVDEAKEPSTIVISGKMSYHANITAVLDFAHATWPLVRQRHPGIRLRIVGSGPPESIRALTRDPDVEVTGYVDDVRPAIRRATVAVCPVTVKVGIQNKILEAMALGVPVVSTKAGAVGLQAVPGQDLLVGQDAAHVANLIHELLVDPHRRKKVAAAGRRYVETHHRWDIISSRLERAYDETLARVRGAAAR